RVGSRPLFVGSKMGCVGSLFANNSFKNNTLYKLNQLNQLNQHLFAYLYNLRGRNDKGQES
ncbi:hypothetical protein, partial [Escherichia coli]|uniref:hypothetical protein n=1 Tax=Escherichia coli TaxID=562 RepID=UPI001B8B2C80